MLYFILFIFSFKPIEVFEYNLKNGLKVLIYEDHSSQAVSTQLHYRVGSYNEVPGLTGISHLLEHMAFKGTKRYGPKEYDRLIDEAGGEENAFTSTHETVYWANLQKDRYELELKLEADRMQNLLIPPDEFQKEKMVVMEERRLIENDPYGSFFEYLDLFTYTYHPYRNPTIGFMSDIERINRDDIYNWYKKYYNPANAIIVIAGDVKREEAIRLVEKHFGRIKGKRVMEVVFIEPKMKGERHFEMRKDVQSPAIAMSFLTVPLNVPDIYALDVISRILSSGRSSRFERILVREKGIAARAWAYNLSSKYGGCFVLFGIPQVGIKIDTLKEALETELQKLKDGNITEEELKKAKNQALAQFVFRQDSPAGIGFSLGKWEIETGSWQNINRYPAEIQKVTIDDIVSVANRYFQKENRVLGYLLPEEER